MKLIGIVFVVLGTLALLYGGFTFITHEKVVDVGPLEVRADRERSIWIPPVAGAVTVGVGLLMVLAGRRSVV